MSCTHNKPTANRRGPTTSGPVEDEFVAEVKRRFRTLRGLVRRTVGYENDALGLTDEDDPLLANAEERERFEFNTQPELVNKFIRWLKGAIKDEILEPVDQDETLENHWIAPLIQSAYINGFNQATGLLFQQGASVDNPPNSEILSRPISARTLQDLYTRTFENLRDITRDMADVIREELTEGLAKGENPKAMARRLTGELRDIQRSRAETLARTEIINSHTTAMLDRYEEANIDVVAHEWRTAEDDRVCPFCSRLNGVRLGIEEVRNGAIAWAEQKDWKPQIWRLQPPAHPRCRCLISPILGADVPTTPLSERIRGDEAFDERADVLL